MLYQLQPGDTIQSAAKVFGYTDYQQFFKTMRYVGDRKTFTPGTVIECPSAVPTPRDRPYDGQDHTDAGLRGKTFIQGLTMRDVADCINRAFALSVGTYNPELYAQADKGELVDLYELDLTNVDPGAVIQNATCEIEKMMGIFPNVPEVNHEG